MIFGSLFYRPRFHCKNNAVVAIESHVLILVPKWLEPKWPLRKDDTHKSRSVKRFLGVVAVVIIIFFVVAVVVVVVVVVGGPPPLTPPATEKNREYFFFSAGGLLAASNGVDTVGYGPLARHQCNQE